MEKRIVLKSVNFVKIVIRIFLIALIGFVGGFLAQPFYHYLGKIAKISPQIAPGDAISVANTYIVFTTFIFAGLAVFLTILGFVFAQQFANAKEVQSRQLFEEMRELLKVNRDEIGIKLLDIMLDNQDVVKHLEQKFDVKIDQIIKSKQPTITTATTTTTTPSPLKSKIGGP